MSTDTQARELRLDFRLVREGFTLEVEQRLDLTKNSAIFGASGSGKTSLLRVIAGLERSATGTVAFDNAAWQTESSFTAPWLRRIGFVFQDARLFPHLSVAENLRLRGKARSMRPRFDEAEVIDALAIGHLLRRATGALSGGESQRVAIARALVSQPDLLLMDEPVSSLDARSRHDTLEYVAAAMRRFDLPLVYVTHDADEVARLAANTLLLDNGRVTAYGRTPDVFASMRSTAAGGDTASILVAHIADAADGLTGLRIGGQQLRVTTRTNEPGAQIQLRVLARDVVLATRRIADTSIRNVLSGTVTSIDELDRGTTEVRIEIEKQTLKAHVTTLAVDELGLHNGAPVYAMIKSVALGSAARDEAE